MYSSKEAYLVKNITNIESLILGSSHAYYGIDPGYMSGRAFSLANTSQTLDYDDWLISKYINQMPNLKYVVVPVSYFSLLAFMDKEVEDWRSKYYRIYFHKKDMLPITYNFEAMQTLKSTLTKIMNYYYKKQVPSDYTELGFGTTYKLENRLKNWEDSGPISAKRHTKKINKSDVAANVNHIINIIKQCQNKGVKVLLITPPAHKSYIKHLEKQQLALTITTCERLSREYQVQYYNLMENPEFVSADFYDSDHLNQYGARKLSINISRHLNSLPQ